MAASCHRMRRLALALLIIAMADGSGRAEACADGRLRVAIDVGHSKSVPGAKSATGKLEYDFNRRFADELLQRAGELPALDLVLLEPSGRRLGLQERAKLASDHKASAFLSIHHDSVQRKYLSHWVLGGKVIEYSDVFSGFSLFVWQQNGYSAASLKLATAIGRNLTTAGFIPTLHHAEPIKGENRQLLNRVLGVYEAPFVVLKSSLMPAVLFEVGVIVNRSEEQRLDDPTYRSKIQDGILRALQEYCSNGP